MLKAESSSGLILKISRYYSFSEFLKSKYGQKVYKLPINIKVTCPNRDGVLGKNGCTFCGQEGTAFENLSSEIDIKDQLEKNAEYIGKRYSAKLFIAYLQNYSNTYLKDKDFEDVIYQIVKSDVDIVAIYISTRPDCLNDSKLKFLKDLKKKYQIDIVIELGLQTANYTTLKKLNRGHGLSHFIYAVNLVHKFGMQVCAHVIVDLPYDNVEDVMETADILNALEVEQVKCHSLYILKDTTLGDDYEKGLVKPITYEEYIERMIIFIRTIHKSMVIGRLVGRAPKERSLFCNYQKSWWVMKDDIEEKLESLNAFQGDMYTKFSFMPMD